MPPLNSTSITFATACSGIGAPEVAFTALGWKPLWCAEIDPFACAVLDARHGAPNLGNMEAIRDAERPDVLVAGTPCQSFSIAGLRRGLDDPRGNLALVFLGLADRLRPEWTVWENVPGVLSHDGGRTFGTFLGAMVQLGYGWAYRVLDAQYVRVESHARAVPQRRRRVFVVGHRGGWRRAAAVLLEPESMRGDPPPRRKAVQETTHEAAGCIGASGRGFSRAGDPRGQDPVVAMCLNAGGQGRDDTETQTFITHALSADGHDASEDGTGRGTPLVPAAFGVRRLTPRECERLQGFDDDYTAITYRGKPAKDSPRYRAIGNSMAVNVMSWIGQRIALAHRRR